MTTTLRPAIPQEAEELGRLARRAKSHWPYERELLMRMLDALTIDPETIRHGIFYVAEDRSRLSGVAGAVHTQYGWELEHLWIDPSAMGKGLGRQLLKCILRECANRGISVLTFTSDPHAEGFYQRIGAMRIGSRASTVMPDRNLPLFSIMTDSNM